MLEHLNTEDWPPLPFSSAALEGALKEYAILAADPFAYALYWECEKCGKRGREVLTTSADAKRSVLLAHHRKSGGSCKGTAHVRTWREEETPS